MMATCSSVAVGMMTAGLTGLAWVGTSGGKMRDISGIDGASLELMVEEEKSGIKETSKDGMSAGDASWLVVLGGKSG